MAGPKRTESRSRTPLDRRKGSPVSGFAMLRIDTPLGAVNFPMFPGVKARGSASVGHDGGVNVHVIVDPHGLDSRRHIVYSVSRKADPEIDGLLDIKLLRDDGELLL